MGGDTQRQRKGGTVRRDGAERKREGGMEKQKQRGKNGKRQREGREREMQRQTQRETEPEPEPGRDREPPTAQLSGPQTHPLTTPIRVFSPLQAWISGGEF